MSDELILRQASPTLAGLKTGSLFTVPYRTESELRADVADMNRRLAPKGVDLRVLRVRRRALLYLYRPSYLSRDFSQAEAASLLRQYGYAAADSEQCLERLAGRLRVSPYTVYAGMVLLGVSLSYHPVDVLPLMTANNGRGMYSFFLGLLLARALEGRRPGRGLLLGSLAVVLGYVLAFCFPTPGR